MKIYILRHGETPWNKERRLQGRSDVELNERGRELARVTSEGMKDIPFDVVFTSPLKRARETANIVLGGRKVPMIDDERIAEISFGVMEGKPWRKTDVWEGDPNMYAFFNDPEKYRAPEGGETLEALAERTADFMNFLYARQELQNRTILVSTHGAATRGLLNSLRTWELSDFWHGGVAPNCGVSIVEYRDGKAVLLEENKTYYELKENVSFTG